MANKVQLSKKDRFSVAWRHQFLQGSWNYERMQNGGWCYSIIPAIKKLYPEKEEQIAALKRHLEFYNTHPYVSAPVMGVTLALEEERANGAEINNQAIQGVKVGMMGPLAGIGDSMMFAILGPLLISIPASMALTEDFTGALVALIITQIIFISWNLFVKWKLITLGYQKGADLATSSAGMMDKVTFGAGIVGLIVVGGMIGSIINITTPIQANFGGYEFVLQTTLDSLFPKLLPVLAVLGVFHLLRNKKWSPVKIVICMFILFTTLGALGIVA